MNVKRARDPALSRRCSGRHASGWLRWRNKLIKLNARRLAVLSAVFCLAGAASSAHADWAACQSKPTRACLLEEALRGDGGTQLAGKDRLDVLLQANAYAHIEYATAADIDEAVRQAQQPRIPFAYVSVAIRGLIAENRKQQAADLVASYQGAYLSLAFLDFVRTLAKAGDLDTSAALFDRIAPTLDASWRSSLGQARVIESVKTLAEAGKMDDALSLMMSIQTNVPGYEAGEMQMAVGQAYAGRGDTKTAQRYLDLAGQTLEKALLGVVGSATELIRFSQISLSALRGETEAVKTAMQKLQSEAPPADPLTAGYRRSGYQRVVAALLKAKLFPLALEIAESTPDTLRDSTLAAFINVAASNGRIDDARAALASFGEKADPRVRAGAVRDLAVAMAKAGQLVPAVAMAAQVSDATNRKGVPFAIAQNLPQ